MDLPQPQRLLDGLLAVSLVEQREASDLLTREYQCSQLVVDWLLRSGVPAPRSEWLKAAADYQVYLYRHERANLAQAAAAHEALQIADEQAAADRWALDRIVEPLNRAGLYATLLSDWLPTICRAQEPGVRAEALNQTGKQLTHIGDYETALTYLKQSLAISQKIGDRQSEGGTLNNISQIFEAWGDYDRVLHYRKQSLAISQEIGDRTGVGTMLNNIGEVYRLRGDYETAYDYLSRSLEIRQKIGDRSGEASTLNNISLIYYARDNYKRALYFLKRSLAVLQEIGDPSREGITLSNIGEIYRLLGDYKRAINSLKQALAIQQKIGNSAGFCAALFNMGYIHWQNGEKAEALRAWVNVYRQAHAMNLAQALDALKDLAGQLGLPGGMDAWESLARQMDGSGGDGPESS